MKIHSLIKKMEETILARLNLVNRMTSSMKNMQDNHRCISDVQPATKYIKIDNKNSMSCREIAYKKHEGLQEGKVLYIPGFMSDKSGNKARTLTSLCQRYGLTYTSYDPTGLGESRPIPPSQARFSHWIEDAERVLHLCDGPQTIVASSMGAWIALLLCLEYPDKFNGLVLVAPSVNFVQRYRTKIKEKFSESVVERLERGETVALEVASQYGAFPISYDLLNNMAQYELDFSEKLNVTCPVRIIHGLMDEDVPFRQSLDLLQNLKAKDVHLTYIKDGDHRLSREEDLQLLWNIVYKLSQR